MIQWQSSQTLKWFIHSPYDKGRASYNDCTLYVLSGDIPPRMWEKIGHQIKLSCCTKIDDKRHKMNAYIYIYTMLE